MDNEKSKINLPARLVRPILACLYFIGHMGASKMIENLESYHFKTKYAHAMNFVGTSYGSFLTHRSTRNKILGTDPIPRHNLRRSQ